MERKSIAWWVEPCTGASHLRAPSRGTHKSVPAEGGIPRCLQGLLFLIGGILATGCAPQESTILGPVDCSNVASLPVHTPGLLTVATDDPAYAPWFVDNDPANGRGFESAVAYAVAHEMGFTPAQVRWIRIPFAQAYAPGEKAFDFDVNEVSITAQRQRAVDFSPGYYAVQQVVVQAVTPDTKNDPTLHDLSHRTLGVVVGSTSAQVVAQSVRPEKPMAYYDTNSLAAQALISGQIESLVVDLPTGLEISATSQSQGSIVTVVGSLPSAGAEEFGAVLAKDSPLTLCVSEAIQRLQQKGTLHDIERQWLQDATEIPSLQ